MSGQRDLFSSHDGAFARSTDPKTSRKARDRVGHILNRLEQVVSDSARRAGDRGVTTADVCAQTGEDKWSISPRFKPLRIKGYLKIKINEFGEVEVRGRQQVNVHTGKE